jgi:uncharacterized protein DUF4360
MRKASHFLCVMVGVLATGALFNPAAASGSADREVPPTEEIVIDAAAYGTGCPAGTATFTMAPDNSSVTVSYSNYVAKIGVGAVATDFRKSCQVVVTVHAPADVTFAVSVENAGHASVAAGASVQQRGTNYFLGLPAVASTPYLLNGPVDDEWAHTENSPVPAGDWAPCGAPPTLTHNTELRAAGGTSDLKTTTSSMSMDSTVYSLNWAPCPVEVGR